MVGGECLKSKRSGASLAEEVEFTSFHLFHLLREESGAVTRSLALLTQLSRVQIAEGKAILEQLPIYESIVTE